MKKLLFTFVALLLASNAMADRVVVFDANAGDWPAGFDVIDIEAYYDIELNTEYVTATLDLNGFACYTPDQDVFYYAVNALSFYANNFWAEPEATHCGIKKIVFDCFNFFGMGGAQNISIANEEDIPNGSYTYVMNDFEYEGMPTSTGTFECGEDGKYPLMVDFEGEAYIYKITVYIDADGEEPSEPTAAPSISATTQMGVHAYYMELNPSEDCDLYYRYQKDDGGWSDWILYDGPVAFTEDGYYQVEAYAIAPGKGESRHVGCSFVVTPRTGLDELSGEKTVAGVRYFNMAGQEMLQADGLTIQVTTYSDGTQSVSKIVK